MSKPMTVAALLRVLAKEDSKRLVVLASDSEGNAFHGLRSVSSNLAFDPKRGEIGLAELTPAAVKLGHTEEDVLPKGRPAIVLYP